MKLWYVLGQQQCLPTNQPKQTIKMITAVGC